MTFADSRLFTLDFLLSIDSRLFTLDSRLFTLDSRLFTLDSRLLLSTLDFYSRPILSTLDPRLLDTLVMLSRKLAIKIHLTSILFTMSFLNERLQ